MIQSRLPAILCALIATFSVGTASAQIPGDVSQEQLNAFQKLPPEQQRELVESMSNPEREGEPADQADEGKLVPGAANPDTADTRKKDPDARVRQGDQEQPETPAKELRVKRGSTLIVQVSVRERKNGTAPRMAGDEVVVRTPEEEQILQDRRDRIANGNPYQLDDEARLSLPFLPPMPLGGLTDKQIAQRLNADPRLADLRFAIAILPVKAVGADALKPFGYDLFEQDEERFAPAKEGATPADYLLGPGDNITVELFGKKTQRYRLVVNRDGAITIPEFGPIQVAGLSFDHVREDIERRVGEQMIGTRANVTLGQLRTLRVFVVGDVKRPGSQSISSLSTITSALFASGGVTEVGSLRNIELKRRGVTVTRFDLYDLLLRGDTSHDTVLQQGDAIFVPAVGSTAGVTGEVRRPAIYEVKDGTSIGDLVQMAGGLKPEAASRAARLQRIDESGERTVLDLNLASATDRARPVHSGDIVLVPKVLDEYAGSVTLDGHVQRAGPYAWRRGMRLTDVLGGLEALLGNADQRYLLIRRQRMPDRTIEVISADAVAAFAARGSNADPVIENRDRITVFSRQADRGTELSALLEELKLQVRDNKPAPVVSVGGRVRSPGDYPFETNMTVSDLVRAGGGLDDAAYALGAELTRHEVINGETRKTQVIDLDLRAAAGGNHAADIPIQPYDVLVIKEVPQWREQEAVTVAGEVRFPGKYPIRYGETLTSLIERAGGLSVGAFPAGSVFLRKELKVQEREQIETLTNRLQSDLAVLALQGSMTKDQQAGETLSAGQSLLQQLRGAEPKGRLVVDVERAMAHRGSDDDIQLRDGDMLRIPRLRQYVTVIGEVQNATSHVWKRGMERTDYIAMSGGTTRRADDKRIYVVRANGSVVPAGNRWFSSGGGELEPGSTVVVPIDAERMRPLPLWTAVTTIVYNLAIAAAAINSF